MEPRIQYAKTSDAVSIAYWTLGEGRPLVHAPLVPFGHMQLEWQMPEVRRWYEGLAQERMLVGYDRRGTGLSDRDVVDYSLDAQVLDLEAIVERLGITRLALFAGLYLGPVAIAYAARHPDKVTHLLLWCTWAHPPKGVLDATSRYAVLDPLREADWKRYTETVVAWTAGWEQPQEIRKYAALFREGSTPESARAYVEACSGFDASASLKEIQSPTLVLAMRGGPRSFLDSARQLASEIPGARLASFETPGFPWNAAEDSMLAAIDDFLGEGEPAAAPLPSGTAVILFADIADSTALTERMGDTAFRAKARELDTALREIIREVGGTPVEGKLLGDGVLAVFTSARQAIEAALRCGKAGSHGGLPLHLGVHAGDVIREEDPDGRGNVYGGAVNIAARIAAASAPGEVLVSDTLRGLARTSAGVSFEDRGEQTLKGVGDPQRLFAVREGGMS